MLGAKGRVRPRYGANFYQDFLAGPVDICLPAFKNQEEEPY